MLRALALVTLCAVGAVASADGRAGAKAPGKVVRIERGGGIGTPRFCSVSVNNDKLAAYCFGPSVNVGEKIVAVSADHHHLVLDIAKAVPYQPDCTPATVWNVTPTLHADATVAPNSSEVFVGLIDGGMDAERSVLYMPIAGGVSGRSDGNGAVGIDRRGIGRPDIAWEQHSCDAAIAQNVREDTCFEVWETTGASWHRLRSDVFHTCR
jgi:hypothetical protein